MRYKWKMGECAGIWKEEFVLDARESVNKTSFGENYGVKTVKGCVEVWMLSCRDFRVFLLVKKDKVSELVLFFKKMSVKFLRRS